MDEENFPVELMDACLDFFAHQDSVDLTYLGQRVSGQYVIMARDTLHQAEFYLIDLTRRPPTFEQFNPNH